MLSIFYALPRELLQNSKKDCQNEKENKPKISHVTHYLRKDLINLGISLSLRKGVGYIYSR